MKRDVFISALFFLELNVSGTGLPHQNYLININRPDALEIKPVLEIRPRVFTTVNTNSQKLYEEKECYLLTANNTEQTSRNKSQVLHPSVFVLEEGNSGIRVLHRKKSYSIKKETRSRGIIVEPSSNLIKVPP